MSLRERLHRGNTAIAEPVAAPAADAVSGRFEDIKRELHQRLIDDVDLAKLEKMAPAEMRAELRHAIGQLAEGTTIQLNRIERERLVQELFDEVTGLGPLEPLLADPSISDILVNGCTSTFIERGGLLSEVPVRFRDHDHLMLIINRIVSRVGRRIDETSPMVDARLADGSRVNAIIPPLALDGPSLSIRRFGARPLRAEDLVTNRSLTRPMLDFIAAAVKSKLNILISGGTGSGKTTLLNVLSGFIPSRERIVTIEDAAELILQQRHVVRLETRPANVEGNGAIRQRELVRNSLRMRPDRIIVGEVRGAEVLDMLQAMNTGHEGSMTTVHANTTRDALGRLITMAGLEVANFSESLMMQTVARALHLIVHVNRFPDGKRRVVSISEITGMEGEVITMQDLFTFDQKGLDADHNVLGDHRTTGVRPRCLEHMVRHGFDPSGSFAL